MRLLALLVALQFASGGAECVTKRIRHTTTGTVTCTGAVGDSCTYSCALGYQDTGSGNVTCGADGVFTDGECAAQPCADMPIANTIDNGGTTICRGSTDGSCAYTCLEGYRDSGSGSVLCLPKGSFEPATCSPNSCQPKEISHTEGGSTTCEGKTGDTCSFTCADGYSASGALASGSKGHVACGADSGTFSDGGCTPDPCIPRTIENTDGPDGTTVCKEGTGQVCSYTCAEGYSATGSEESASTGTIKCESTHEFDEGRCTPLMCDAHAIEFTSDGTTECSGVTGDTCEYSCAEGYEDSVSGLESGSSRCLSTSSWSAGSCVPKACTDGGTVPHSNKDAKKGKCIGSTGDVCPFHCDPGYSLGPVGTVGADSGSIRCQETGSFTNAECTANPCQELRVPLGDPSGVDISTKICTGNTGDICHYHCAEGYKATQQSADGTTECLATGEFEHSDSTRLCSPQPCRSMQVPDVVGGTGTCEAADGTTSSNCITCIGAVDSECTYTCAPGYADPHRPDAAQTNIDRKVKCLPSLTFGEGTCVRKDCLDEMIANSAPSNDVSGPPTTCSGKTESTCDFHCAQGYGLASSALHTYGSKDQLSGTTTCTARGASDPQFTTIHCKDIDECATDNAGCSPDATCVNTEGSFYCAACANACCSGGTRTAWPTYGPTDLCCAPGQSTDCNLCDSYRWLEEVGCIGPPDSGQSYVQLFTALNGEWHARDFDDEIVAGTTLMIAIDAKDSRGHRDAQLDGLCEASAFRIDSSPEISPPSSLDRTPKFVSEINVAQGSAHGPFAGQYYVSNFVATVSQTYSISVRLTDGDGDFVQQPASIAIIPAAADRGRTLQTLQGVCTNPCDDAGADENPISRQCVSTQCISNPACKSMPGRTIAMDVSVFDAYGNPRNNRDEQIVRLQVANRPSGVDITSSWDDKDHVYHMTLRSDDDMPGPIFVEVDIGDIVLHAFNYTSSAAAVGDVEPLLSIGTGRGARRSMIAGEANTFTVIVEDDRCQPGEIASYTHCIGCIDVYNLETSIVIAAEGVEGLLPSDAKPEYHGHTKSVNHQFEPQCEENGISHPGCLEYNFAAEAAGVYRISLLLGASALQFPGSSWSVHVNPSTLDISRTRQPLEPEFPFRESEAGRSNTFFIRPLDVYGNLRDQEPLADFSLSGITDTLTLTVSGPQFQDNADSSNVGAGLWDDSLKQFSVSRNLTVSGDYTFVLTFNSDQQLLERTVSVLPATTCPANTDVVLHEGSDGSKLIPDLILFFAGTPRTFRFTPRDRWGNVRAGQFGSTNMDQNDTLTCQSDPANFSFEQAGGTTDSPYRVTLRTTVSSATPYSISIVIAPKSRPDGVLPIAEDVPGSPLSVFVRPADLSVRDCNPPPESGPGYNTAVAGRGAQFTVVPRDKFGNIRCQDIYSLNDSLAVVATKEQSRTDGVVEWSPSNTSCDSSARWYVSLPLTDAGEYSIEVNLGNMHPSNSLHPIDVQAIPRAPFPVIVMPDAWALDSCTVAADESTDTPEDLALAKTCVASRPGSCSSWPGKTLEFIVTIVDRFGNLRKRGQAPSESDDCEFVVTHPDRVKKSGLHCSPNGGKYDGTYRVSVTTTDQQELTMISVRLRVWNGTAEYEKTDVVERFNYTVGHTAPLEITENLDITQAPNMRIAAGVENYITVQVQDDQCQPQPKKCFQPERYTPEPPDDCCVPISKCVSWGILRCKKHQKTCTIPCQRQIEFTCPSAVYSPETGCVVSQKLADVDDGIKIMIQGTRGDAGLPAESDQLIVKHYPNKWKGAQSRDNPYFNSSDHTAMLDYGVVITIAGVYDLWLSVSTGELGSDFRWQNLTVNPTQLDIDRSFDPFASSAPENGVFLEYTALETPWLSQARYILQTVAGALNNFSVVPKDRYGNVRDQKPSVFDLDHQDELEVLMTYMMCGRSACPNGTQYRAHSWWDVEAHKLRAEMRLSDSPSPTVAGSYSLSVMLGPASDLQPLPSFLSGVGLPIFVRPSDLSITHSGPGNGFDPDLFESTVAGRLSSFAVVPRDEYMNVRNQTLFGFSDQVAITFRGASQQSQYPSDWALPRENITWKPNDKMPSMDASVRPHFLASFSITVSGSYTVTIMLSSTAGASENRVSMMPVTSAVVGLSQLPSTVVVMPATLAPDNTHFLATFATSRPVERNNTMQLLLRDQYGNNRGERHKLYGGANDTLILRVVNEDDAVVCNESLETHSQNDDHTYGEGSTPCNDLVSVSWMYQERCGVTSCYQVSFEANRTGTYKVSVFVGIDVLDPVSGTVGIEPTICGGSHTCEHTQGPWQVAVHSSSAVQADYTRINGCEHGDFFGGGFKGCYNSMQPYLTMPLEPNILHVEVLDQWGNPIDHPVTLSAKFEIISATGNASLADGVNYRTTQFDTNNKGEYQLNFTFHDVEATEYDVTIQIANLSDTPQNLTSVRYKYALHPQLMHERAGCSEQEPDQCKTALRASVCEKLECMDVYTQSTIDDHSGMRYSLWRQRCEKAGCLYKAGSENAVSYSIESGFWHRYDGYNKSWDGWTNQLAPSININVHSVEVVCNGTREAPLNDTGGAPPCPLGRRVYWRLCDNVTDVATLSTEADCNVDSEGKTCTAQFMVQKPGTYTLTTSLRVNGNDPAEHMMQLPPVSVVVGPGQLSVPHSLLFEPRKTNLAYLPENRDVADTGMLGPSHGNPRTGPAIKDGKLESRIVYDYSIAMKDNQNNRRDGTDQLLVKVELVPVNDEDTLKASATAQPKHSGFGKRCFATRALKTWLEGSDKQHKAASGCTGDIIDIAPDPSCWQYLGDESHDHAFSGKITFQSYMEGVYGVFMLQAWACPLDPDGQYDSCVNFQSTPTKNDVNPMYQTTKPGSSQEAQKQPQPMIFTVCPANSDTSAGLWQTTGFVNGAYLHTCSCAKGYMGRKGMSCQACQHGKYTSTAGSPICSDCAVGKHCSCSTSGNCGEGAELPACVSCSSCSAGQYQPTQGQADCERCPPNFNCNEDGMTFPVAFPGLYVDPKDPKKTHQCTLGSDKLPSSNGLAQVIEERYAYNINAPKLKVIPDGVSDWDGTQAGARGNACPGGNVSLAKALKCVVDEEMNLVSSTDSSKSELCRLAVGALCLEGYSGPEGSGACSTCCKAGQPGCDTDSNWYLKPDDKQCYKCESSKLSVVIALVAVVGLTLAPIILRLAEVMKHAGALQAPVMSVINMLQSADLFQDLNLHWPPKFTYYVRMVASLFNFTLPQLPYVSLVRPECAFAISYTQKWFLEMSSPVLVYCILRLFVVLRGIFSILAREVLVRRYHRNFHLHLLEMGLDEDKVKTKLQETQWFPCCCIFGQRNERVAAEKERESTWQSIKRILVTVLAVAVVALGYSIYHDLAKRNKCMEEKRVDLDHLSSDCVELLRDHCASQKSILSFGAGLTLLVVSTAMVMFKTHEDDWAAEADDPLDEKEIEEVLQVVSNSEANGITNTLRTSMVRASTSEENSAGKSRLSVTVCSINCSCAAHTTECSCSGACTPAMDWSGKCATLDDFKASLMLKIVHTDPRFTGNSIKCVQQFDSDFGEWISDTEMFNHIKFWRGKQLRVRVETVDEDDIVVAPKGLWVPPSSTEVTGASEASDSRLDEDDQTSWFGMVVGAVGGASLGAMLASTVQTDRHDGDIGAVDQDSSTHFLQWMLAVALGVPVGICCRNHHDIVMVWCTEKLPSSWHLGENAIRALALALCASCVAVSAVTGMLLATTLRTQLAVQLVFILLLALPLGYIYSSLGRLLKTLFFLEDFDNVKQADACDKVRYMLLVFCQVGYVFLVSSALQPLSCFRDVDKKWYMSANPSMECSWCKGTADCVYDDVNQELTYPAIASISYVFASVYAVGIPVLFFYIMYSQRDKLRTAKFNKHYGFLTSKTSERFYWWEVAIIVRKLLLSIVTKHSIDRSGTEGSTRQTLCNMVIVFIACTAQVSTTPFAHSDANYAETATLFCTMLVLIVGLGTREVTDEDGVPIVDPQLKSQKLSEAESSLFYVLIYTTMGLFCIMTCAVILRRLGGLRFRTSKRSYMHPEFWRSGMEHKYLPEDVSFKKLEKYCIEQGIPKQKIDRFGNKESDTQKKKLIYMKLLENHHQTCYNDKKRWQAGLPDEIMEMISKNKIEPALAWFNEEIDVLPDEAEAPLHTVSMERDVEDGVRGSIRNFVLHAKDKLTSWSSSGNEPQYKVKDDDINDLITVIRHYKDVVDSTGLRVSHKFARQFSAAGYKNSGRYGIYYWLGVIAGTTEPVDPDATQNGNTDPGEIETVRVEGNEADTLSAKLGPLIGFLARLEEHRVEQLWATLPHSPVDLRTRVQSAYGACYPERKRRTEQRRAKLLEPMRQTTAGEMMMSVADEHFSYSDPNNGCWTPKVCTIEHCGTRIASFVRHRRSFAAILLVMAYFGAVGLWINSQRQLCCPAELTFDFEQTTLCAQMGSNCELLRVDRNPQGEFMLGKGATLGLRRGPDRTCPESLQSTPACPDEKINCARTPDQTCGAACDADAGYFPRAVLRRQAEQRTWNEQFSCDASHVSSLGLVFGLATPPIWVRSRAKTTATVPTDGPSSFSCVKAIPIYPNTAPMRGSISYDEQQWFVLETRLGVHYRVIVNIDSDPRGDDVDDTVVCVYTNRDQFSAGGQAMDEQRCEGHGSDVQCHSAYCNDDTEFSLGSQMSWTQQDDSPRYIVVYARRVDEVGEFNITVVTGCSHPEFSVGDVDTESEDFTQRPWVLDQGGQQVGWLVDSRHASTNPCSAVYVGHTEQYDDRCSFQCAEGYVPRADLPQADSQGRSYLECWYPGADAGGLCSDGTGRNGTCQEKSLNRDGTFNGGLLQRGDSLCVLDMRNSSNSSNLGDSEEVGVTESTSFTATELSSSAQVSWTSHRLLLMKALAEAGLADPDQKTEAVEQTVASFDSVTSDLAEIVQILEQQREHHHLSGNSEPAVDVGHLQEEVRQLKRLLTTRIQPDEQR